MHRKWWTLAAVCTGVFMLLMDLSIVNVALPSIEDAFSAGLSDIQWVVDAYALTLAVLLLTAGSVADLVGRRLVFGTGIAVFTIASALCGAAPDATFLVVSRGLQGAGGAMMFATSLALLAQEFAPEERGTAFGIFGAVTGGAVAVGPVLGGAVTTDVSWRWIFFINVPAGLALLAVTVLRLRESKPPGARRPDIPGAVSFGSALAAFVYGLIKSQSDGWGSATVVIPLSCALVLLVAFLVVQGRSRHPMLDLSLLRIPTFTGGLVAGFAISASIFSLTTYLTLYMQGVLGYSAIATGVRLLPFTGAIFLVAPAAGRLTVKVPVKYAISGGFLLLTIAMLLMRGITAADGWTHLLPGFVLAGIGCPLIAVPLSSTAVGVVEPERGGMASGISATARQVGIATGVAVLGTILATSVRDHVTDQLAATPLAPHADRIATAAGSGSVLDATRQAPTAFRELVISTARGSYVDALNSVLLIGALIAAAATIVTFLMIRSEDFHHVRKAAAAGRDETAQATSDTA
ncbi:MFS transporter [Streptomyces sp. NPDC051576]|uniref:MFS transporter n=1 Tax=Streptomyces sp. NPDC051576 TaxID=3155803 RepID=UPI0034283EBB